MTTEITARESVTSPDFVISRVIDAPRDLVWKAFTDPEHMKQWWGPKGFTVVASRMDLRVGGSYHYGLKSQDGFTIWGKFVFREIVSTERIVFISSFSDEAGGTTRHPMQTEWPLEMLTSFVFEDQGTGKTKVTVRSSAYNATDKERSAFDAHHDSLRQGWGGTLDKLADQLARVQRN
jgi:uncharacterized protein YndB with AHSA1/START domain